MLHRDLPQGETSLEPRNRALDQWFGRFLRLLGAAVAVCLWLLAAEIVVLAWVF